MFRSPAQSARSCVSHPARAAMRENQRPAPEGAAAICVRRSVNVWQGSPWLLLPDPLAGPPDPDFAGFRAPRGYVRQGRVLSIHSCFWPVQPPRCQSGTFSAGNARQPVKVKLAAIYYATFGGYRRAICLLHCLIGPFIVGAIGVTKEIHCAFQPLL